VQEKGSHCSLGDGLIVCQPLPSSAKTTSETEQHSASDEPKMKQPNLSDEPKTGHPRASDELEAMRISLDFARTDSDEEMSVPDEILDASMNSVVNVDSSLANTDCAQAASHQAASSS